MNFSFGLISHVTLAPLSGNVSLRSGERGNFGGTEGNVYSRRGQAIAGVGVKQPYITPILRVPRQDGIVANNTQQQHQRLQQQEFCQPVPPAEVVPDRGVRGGEDVAVRGGAVRARPWLESALVSKF